MTSHTSAEIRRQAAHPIIDADGHVLEVLDATFPYLREALGATLFQKWLDRGDAARISQRARTADERRRTRTPQGSWWGGPPSANTLDRATATLPALLHERMDSFGVDFTVLYPTVTLLTPSERDPDLRRGLCAGTNAYFADIYGPYADRMTMAGVIPMFDPEEAIAELHHCKALGLKAIVFPEGVLRPLDEPAPENCSPWMIPGQRYWYDSFGLDSIHNYDPVWEACQSLGFAAAFHGGMAPRPGIHFSISSYVANHVGQFAAEMYPLCKSLLFGGVTARFPKLPIVFLECGVSWAMQMLCDTIEHWHKRNVDTLHEMLDPAHLDKQLLGQLFEKYGGKLAELIEIDPITYVQKLPVHGSTPEELDEFIHMNVKTEADIVERFAPSFYFGCEADDRGIATAYSHASPAPLRTLFSSDIGHWDVPDMSACVEESFELVEHGVLTSEQWRQVVFDNPVELYTRVNPNFFDGTPVAAHLK